MVVAGSDSDPFVLWPTPDELLNGFIRQATLIESGRYLKITIPSEPTRALTIWIGDDEVHKSAAEIADGAAALYPRKSISEGIAAVVASELFECLGSLPVAATEIVFRRGGFYAVT
jgi:hypothetical protein